MLFHTKTKKTTIGNNCYHTYPTETKDVFDEYDKAVTSCSFPFNSNTYDEKYCLLISYILVLIILN